MMYSRPLNIILKGKGNGPGTCYTIRKYRLEQQRFTISEVAADWHELQGRLATGVYRYLYPQYQPK